MDGRESEVQNFVTFSRRPVHSAWNSYYALRDYGYMPSTTADSAGSENCVDGPMVVGGRYGRVLNIGHH